MLEVKGLKKTFKMSKKQQKNSRFTAARLVRPVTP